jgi:hypothetical protein
MSPACVVIDKPKVAASEAILGKFTLIQNPRRRWRDKL